MHEMHQLVIIIAAISWSYITSQVIDIKAFHFLLKRVISGVLISIVCDSLVRHYTIQTFRVAIIRVSSFIFAYFVNFNKF